MNLPTLWRKNSMAPYSIFDEAFGENGIFDRMFRDFDGMSGIVTYQSADNKVMFEIECPGFNKENINVEVADGLATVKGERKIEGRHAGLKSIYQRVTVGEPESVDAKLKDGILYIEATYPEKKKDKIEIKVVEDE
jgi:HSP20 family molecular chaperone IbpA